MFSIVHSHNYNPTNIVVGNYFRMSETKWEWSLQKYARFKGTSQSGLPTDTGTKRIGQSKASADCIKDTKQPETSTDDEVSKWKVSS